jgi:hypothetical protein
MLYHLIDQKAKPHHDAFKQSEMRPTFKQLQARLAMAILKFQGHGLYFHVGKSLQFTLKLLNLVLATAVLQQNKPGIAAGIHSGVVQSQPDPDVTAEFGKNILYLRRSLHASFLEDGHDRRTLGHNANHLTII